MNNPIKVLEITKSTTNPTLIDRKIKITNTSSQYINDIKILIQANDFSIIEQSIIRQRGALDFSPQINCLELGNLAPDETAYFEYKYTTSNTSLSSLSSHLSLSYLLENTSVETTQPLTELICPEN